MGFVPFIDTMRLDLQYLFVRLLFSKVLYVKAVSVVDIDRT